MVDFVDFSPQISVKSLQLGFRPRPETTAEVTALPIPICWIEGVAFQYFLTTKYLIINQIYLSENAPKLTYEHPAKRKGGRGRG